MSHPSIILASSSQTRRELMSRLHLDYCCVSPDIDESSQNETHADDLARRLAFEKAKHVATQNPQAIVIGSDQVAWLLDSPDQFIGKPLTQAHAIAQLTEQSGKTLCFSTALSVQHEDTQYQKTAVVHYQVKFRTLTQLEIERYVQLENPLQCAGSFKGEGLGITLFESMHGDDFTALMGLPLIQLCHYLRDFNITLP